MTDHRYAVREVFSTLQGEGMNSGRPAVFVRFAGCNLWTGREQDRDKGTGACAKWCDTDFFKGTMTTLPDLLQQVRKLWTDELALPASARTSSKLLVPQETESPMVVFSGGEPTLQLDPVLLRAFSDEGYFTAVETNGTNNPSAEKDDEYLLDLADWVTVSPKLGTQIRRTEGEELKVVLPGELNGPGWVAVEQELVQLARGFCYAYAQPMDTGDPGRNAENVKLCLDFVRKHPGWRLSLQTHKLVGLP